MPITFNSKAISLVLLLLLLTFVAPVNHLSAQVSKDEKQTSQLKKTGTPKPSLKTTETELEKKLNELDNLYVPIHWSDYITGLAIGGYDPLSYFISQKSESGDERFQYLWHGVTWQFISKANLLAFKRTPSVYAPRYAGYDAYAISKGLLSEGLPSIWVIEGGKLYLFHNQVNRYLWQENRRKLHKKIEANWRELSLDIPRFKVF
ncbi:MAG: YHS domain-containing (seleno)protein [Rhodomicrobiaceae bacterium]